MAPARGSRPPILNPGTLIGGYRVDSVIGHGGMGVVYEATQLSLKRKIALKLLASHLSDDQRFRERFRREGELQARLDHPHIVTVHEAGESDHGLFLAMRMVRGPRLKDLILDRDLDAQRTVNILSPIADALDAAHEEGLIHRDVKPQNILVGGRDHAFLADFGLTKLPGERSITETGQFMGTLDYVAPEQIVGEKPTTRTDVYAFGAVLCECLTGSVPYLRENEAAVLYAHLSDTPPRLSERESLLPAELDDVIARALAKEPGDRQASAGELMDEVEDVLGGRRLRAIRQPRPVVSPATARAESAPTEEIADPDPDDEATERIPTPGPAADTTQPAARRRGPQPARRALVPLAALVVLGAGAGAAAGALTADSGSERRVVQSSAVGIDLPSDWKGRPEPLPGMKLHGAVGGSDGDRGIMAGVARDVAPSLLPAAFERHVAGAPPGPGEPVRIAGVDARVQSALPLRDDDRRVTVYSVPTTEGASIVACYAPMDGDLGAACDQAAGTLRVRRGEPFPVSPDPDYGDGVNQAMRFVQTKRRVLRQRLGKARTRFQQSEAADRLADAFTGGQKRIARLEPSGATASANADLRKALRNTANAYRHLERSATAADGAGFARAVLEVRDTEAHVQGALDALRPLGYTIL
jgi:hypothetical protein